jgi:hypothetical protein
VSLPNNYDCFAHSVPTIFLLVANIQYYNKNAIHELTTSFIVAAMPGAIPALVARRRKSEVRADTRSSRAFDGVDFYWWRPHAAFAYLVSATKIAWS